MTTERKWKQGDIGPDGRVFWSYQKICKNGERWIHASKFEERLQKSREACRKCIAANPQKYREIRKKWRDSNPEKNSEINRKWREENREEYREARRKSFKKKRKQAAADQFFIMAGAAESISQLK